MKKSWITTLTITIAIVFSAAALASNSPNTNNRGGLYIVEFRGEPDDAQLALLADRGIKLVDHFGKNRFWVRASSAAEMDGLEFVKKAASPKISDKVDLPLTFAIGSARQSDKLETIITFFDDVTEREASALVASAGGTVLGKGMLYGNRMMVEMPSGAVARLAENNLVRAVEAGQREKILPNLRSAEVASVVQTRTDYGLYGSGVTGGIWDGGAVGSHPDLAGRVILGEKSKVSDHATHVAGTIAGSGLIRPDAEGMAPESKLISFNFNGDVPSEMAEAVKDYGISFSNNSWSYNNGWYYHSILKLWIWFGDYYFGRYTSESAAYDKLVYDTNLVIMFAAGNDRADKGPKDYSVKYLDLTIGRGNDVPRPADGPYCSIDVTGSAKNVITVGAVNNKGRMTSFSSWGPTRDGRIKPEVCTVGTGVLSTLPDGTYASWSGTSMATPATSGAVALLFEQYRKVIGRNPSAAEVRALLVATAIDTGTKGPDYSNGFGLLDIHEAAALVESSPEKGLIIRDSVRKAKSARTKQYTFEVAPGTKQLKVALAWIDPPAQPNADKALVNDLDLRLYPAEGGEAQLPWVLDPARPKAAATKGDNDVDNIELVEISTPRSGKWTIEVSADTLNKGQRQEFALVVFADQEILGKVSER
jgi:subtilisin family serine protease